MAQSYTKNIPNMSGIPQGRSGDFPH